MKFSSEDVAQQSFEVRFRGYNTGQVREFLTVIARELETLVHENRRLGKDLDAAQSELADYRKRERSLSDSLEMARSTAENLRASAQREAEDIRAGAHRDAEECRAEAERDAELQRAAAELEAERVVSRAQRAAESMEQQMMRLEEQRRRVVTEMRQTLEMHLHLLDSQSEPEYVEEAQDADPVI